ncbi:hypothetical protein TYRP_008524 [Tyrophagus putrescentiae]|nr:hypothetical protein TYRP_008524 [Tyrophagus putrescentiae]
MEDTTANEDISKHSVQILLSGIKAIKNNNSLAQSLEEAQAIYPKTPDFSASGVGVKTSFLAKINVGNKIAEMESYRLTGVNRLRNTILEMCEQLASTLKKPTEDSQRELIQQVGFVDCEFELFNSVITRLSKQFALLNANPTSDQPSKDAIIKENLALLVAQAIYSSSVLTPLTSEEKKEQAALEKETDQATTSSSSQVVDNSPGHPKFVQCLLAKTRGCLTLLENYSLTGKFGSSHLGGTVHKAKLANNGDSGTLIPLKVQSITEVNCQAIIEQVLLLRKDQLYQHPNILKLEHASVFFNADPEQPAKCPKYYLALAYEPINGGNLSSLADDQWPEPVILRVIWQALLALAYLHSKGIIHNNVNPSNILLHNGNVKIADFGSAKYLTSFEPRVERETTTLRYMAPEMAKTFLKGSPATDEFTTAVDNDDHGFLRASFSKRTSHAFNIF